MRRRTGSSFNPGYLRIPAGSFGRSVGKTDLPSGAVFMNTPRGQRLVEHALLVTY